MPNRVSAALLLIGSLLAAFGFTLVGTYVWKGDTVMVYTGFLIFALSYKLMWYGTNKVETFSDVLHNLSCLSHRHIMNRKGDLGDHFIALTGVLITSFGAVYFGKAVINFSILTATIGGVATFGGYMVTHLGVNKILI